MHLFAGCRQSEHRAMIEVNNAKLRALTMPDEGRKLHGAFSEAFKPNRDRQRNALQKGMEQHIIRARLEHFPAKWEPVRRRKCDHQKITIPRSRHDPKILWVDDAEIVGDRITKVRPIPRNLFTQKTERRIGELGTSCVALVVSDVSVHEAP